MKKQLLIGTAILLLASTSAWAAGDPAGDAPKGAMAAPAAPASVPSETPAPANSYEGGRGHHEWTLEDARKHAHARAEKLDKMTEAEWAAQQKKHHEWRDKWKQMTPEEKDAYKKMRIAKRHHKEQDTGTAPAPSVPASGGQ